MIRRLGIVVMLVTLSFSGCQETEPSKIIVSLQIDSDNEDIWIYLYTTPRVKMGNFTILMNGENSSLNSVFSHQKNFSNNDMIIDSKGYSSLYVSADVSKVFWEYICKFKVFIGEEDGLVYVDLLQNDDNNQEILETKQLPYNVALEYRL